jgi:hypothetical protein
VSAISGEISLDIESGSGYTSEPQIGHSHVLRSQSSLRDFLTVLALSCHAIFEGLAVGLEKDAEAVWTLFAGDYLESVNNLSKQRREGRVCLGIMPGV